MHIEEKIKEYSKYRILGLGSYYGNPFISQYGFEQTLNKLRGKLLRYDEEKLINKIREYGPDYIIINGNISERTAGRLGKIRQIKQERDVKIGWWFWDLRKMTNYKGFRGWQNAVFICNKKYKEDWHKMLSVPTYYMPQCSTGNFRFRGRPEKITWDIVFVGCWGNIQIHGNRAEILTYVKQNLKLKYRNADDRMKRIENDKQSIYLYKHTPFSLEISAPAEAYTSDRPYKILAAKGFLIIKRYPGIERMFENRKHCVWFEKKEEIPKIIEYYYRHPKEYYAIKKAGYELVMKKHTFDARVINILDILSGKTKEFYGYKD